MIAIKILQQSSGGVTRWFSLSTLICLPTILGQTGLVGLSLPRTSEVRLNDRPDMTVYRFNDQDVFIVYKIIRL